MKNLEKIQSSKTIFLDTNILLHAFSIFLKNSMIVEYLKHDEFQYFTFEKCTFEVLMAFRGVGGKKPDEGRGDWANRHLKLEIYPRPMDQLINKVGEKNYSYYLVNQINEVFYDFPYEMVDANNFNEVFNRLLS